VDKQQTNSHNHFQHPFKGILIQSPLQYCLLSSRFTSTTTNSGAISFQSSSLPPQAFFQIVLALLKEFTANPNPTNTTSLSSATQGYTTIFKPPAFLLARISISHP
jgi:hypothetical protein